MLVGNSISEGSVCCLGDRRGVVRYRVFCDRVVDVCTAGLLIQVRPGIRPLVIGAQLNRLSGFLAVRKQLDRDILRLVAILVVSVVPDLCHLDPGLFRRMAVCQGCECAVLGSIGQRITCGQVLFAPGVGDQLSVVILRQMFNGRVPVVRRIQRNGANLGRTIHQVNCQAVRTDTILVVSVGPFLADSNGSLFFSIGDRHLSGAVSVIGIGRCADRRSFYYIIGKIIDRSIRFIQMLRQILPLILPVVGLAQCLGVNNGVFLSSSDFRNGLQSILY